MTDTCNHNIATQLSGCVLSFMQVQEHQKIEIEAKIFFYNSIKFLRWEFHQGEKWWK